MRSPAPDLVRGLNEGVGPCTAELYTLKEEGDMSASSTAKKKRGLSVTDENGSGTSVIDQNTSSHWVKRPKLQGGDFIWYVYSTKLCIATILLIFFYIQSCLLRSSY